MKNLNFEEMLTGGHPNSLGRTVEVVNIILKDKTRLEELYQCYFSDDEVVRLRVSSAMKRVCREHPEWIVPYIDKLLETISKINQASTQWTLAQLFLMLENDLTPGQKKKAIDILKRNLDTNDDWIVQNTTIETLTHWAKDDTALSTWLQPRLKKLSGSHRKSVANRANRALESLKS